MRWIVTTAVVLGGCSFIWDDTAPELPLRGSPPDLSTLRPLNGAKPAYGQSLMSGDGGYWLAIKRSTKEAASIQYDLVPLFEPTGACAPRPVQGEKVTVNWRALFGTSHSADGQRQIITVYYPRCALYNPPQYSFPEGPSIFMVGGRDDRFLFWLTSESTYQVVNITSPSRTRVLPAPAGPAARVGFFFNWNGSLLFSRDGEGRVVAHSTLGEKDTDLGVQPTSLQLDDYFGVLVTCGEAGLRYVPIDGSPARTLDTECESGFFTFTRDHIFYAKLDGAQAPEIWKVTRDESAPPERVGSVDFRRLWMFGPNEELVVSRDPEDRFLWGAGDGWLGGWRFMERGYEPAYSIDGKRLRWLEHGAQLGGSGDLLSAEVPFGVPLRLARNVHQYDEVPDGRILAIANRAILGPHNRLIAIDEQAREARWVADRASRFGYIPGSTDLLVDIVTGGSGHDILRVPLPPK